VGFKTIEESEGSPRGWTYRPNLFLLIPGILLVTGGLIWFLVAASLEAINGTGCQSAKCGGRVAPALGVTVSIMIVVACVTFFSSLFMYIRVSGGVLSAQRPWWRKFEIPVSSVKSVLPGYYGLTITTDDGRVYRSVTPQQANANAWRKKRGISGEVADRIMAARDVARQQNPTSPS
jgi:hypothetical protein